MDSVCADTSLNAAETQPQQAESIDVDNNTNAAQDAVSNDQPQTYDDLFPSLPMAAPRRGGQGGPSGSSGPPIGDWNKKPMLMSSTVTQVCIFLSLSEREARDQVLREYQCPLENV